MASYRTNYFTNNPAQFRTKHPTAKTMTVKAVNQKSGRTLKDIQTPKTKKMSAEMAAWVKANRKKLTSGKQGNIATEKQKALFRQYDALKKEGNLPSTSTVKSRPSPQAQPSTSTKTGGNSPVQPVKQTKVQKTKVQKGAEAVTQRSNPTNTRANRQPGSTGGRGGGGVTPTKNKSRLNPQQRRKAGLTKKRGGTSLKEIIKKFDSKLRLTYKDGQLVQRGDEVYRSDGKGGLKRVYRKQF